MPGFVGAGPVPYQLRVGFPRNIVKPVTLPQGRPTVKSGTTSAALSGNVVGGGSLVVVVVSASLVEGAALAVVGAGVVGAAESVAAEFPAVAGAGESVRNRAAPTSVMPSTRISTTRRKRDA